MKIVNKVIEVCGLASFMSFVLQVHKALFKGYENESSLDSQFSTIYN
jgi:hypothetical protein